MFQKWAQMFQTVVFSAICMAVSAEMLTFAARKMALGVLGDWPG